MKKVIILSICLLFLATACTNKNESKSTSPKKEETTKEIVLVTENTNKEEPVLDDEVVEYINDVTNEVSELDSEKSLSQKTKESLKKTFITLTDFIFYDGTIKGKTFKELSSEAQEKVLELYEKLDSKIESVFPNYKEEIKDTSTKTYSKVKEKAKELKEKIKSIYIERVGKDTYQKEMEIIENTKEKVIEKASPIISDVKDKAKETYTKTKDKLDKWYKNFKESSE